MAQHSTPGESRIDVPDGLARRSLGPDWGDWLGRLPGLTRAVIDEWTLTVDGAAMHGFCSLVLPVRVEEGAAAVLKLSFDGDDESEHEALALQRWGGDGTVRLLRADPRRRALLLERIGPGDLTACDPVAAAEVVAGLYRRLHLPAPPQLRTVTSYVDRWLDGLAAMPTGGPIPHRYAEQAMHLGRALTSDPASVGVMVHGDLHDENVLAADREPWLVIDPKPMSGDPHYEPAPMLWNRWPDFDVRAQLRQRFHTLVDYAELDEDRARDWVIVRMILNAHRSLEDAARADRPLTADEREWITRCITLAKAVQD